MSEKSKIGQPTTRSSSPEGESRLEIALSKALADIVMLKAELADARAEIKDLNRPRGMSWEEATCGDPESE